MKRLATAAALGLLFCALMWSPVFATENGMERVGDRQEFRQENKMERKELREEQKTERKALTETQKTEMMDTAARLHGQRLEKRFGSFSTRFGQLIERLQQRIARMKTENKDVALAETKLNEVKTNKVTAEAKSAEAVASFQAVVGKTGEEQKTALATARSNSDSARKAWETVLKGLKEVTKELKKHI